MGEKSACLGSRAWLLSGKTPNEFLEFKNKTAVVQHEDQCCRKKQAHKQVQHAVSFTSSILDVFHIRWF
jgi:hypothetical protein